MVKVVSHDDMHSEIYGLHGLNRQIIETSLDVTSVTTGLTCERRAVFCLGAEFAKVIKPPELQAHRNQSMKKWEEKQREV